MILDVIKRRMRERGHYASWAGWGAGLYSRLLRRTALPLPKRRSIVPVTLKGVADPFYFRLGTTDLLVLEEIFFHGEYDAVLPQVPHDAKLIVDLGANVGYSIRFWQLHFPQAVIIAAEPDAENARLCRMNLAPGRRSEPVEIVEACVGATERFVRLESRMGEWAYQMVAAAGGSDQGIPVKTLPQIIGRNGQLPRVDLLKCDIEGAEIELFGDCQTWIGNVDRLVVEIHPPYTPEKLLADIRKSGVDFSVISRTKSATNPVVFLARPTFPCDQLPA